MKSIKFVRDYVVSAEGGEAYEKGQIVTLPVTSAMHFINRGVATETAPTQAVADSPAPKRRGRPPKQTESQQEAKAALEE